LARLCDAGAYRRLRGHVKARALARPRAGERLRGSYVLRKTVGDEVEFVTILLWDSIDAIRAIAGPDFEKAVVPEERRKHLTRYDATATHYEIAATHGLAGA
jgi:hypothetical protein